MNDLTEVEKYIAWAEDQRLANRPRQLEDYRQYLGNERRRSSLELIVETLEPHVGSLAPADVVRDIHRIATGALEEAGPSTVTSAIPLPVTTIIKEEA